jgi:hypothetical protein
VIPKSILGVSIPAAVLLNMYLFYRPTYRLLADRATLGLDLSLGTITDGLRRLVPLLEPVYEALVKRSQGQALWHADQTRWLVFFSIEGKVGHRWYLWVFHAAEVVFFVLAGRRSHDVPEDGGGLTVFVEHPEVPMDNNTGKRLERGPVVGRKNYYGSGAFWSGQLAAMLFSLFQTLCLWDLNPRSG